MANRYTRNQAFGNNSENFDFFEEIYSNGPIMTLAIVVFLIGVILGIIGTTSIIWYERNCSNRYRTVINQLFAQLSWYIFIYTLLVYIPEGIRFWYGPYGETYCDFLVVSRNVIWDSVLLTLDCIVVLRYLFIFKLKNFAVICDDVLARIFNSSIIIVSFWAAFVKRVTPGKMPMVFYLCAGKDPNNDGVEGQFINATSKYNTGRVIVAISAFLHLLLIPRILYYQLVTLKHQQPLKLGILNNEPDNRQIEVLRRRGDDTWSNKINQNSNKTIIDIATQVIFLMYFVVTGIIISISEHVEPRKMNLDEYQYIPLTIQTYGPFFAYVIVFTILFTRNEAMRKSLWKKLKICSRKNQIGIED